MKISYIESFRIKIVEADFDNNFGDNENCAIATALKRINFSKPYVKAMKVYPLGKDTKPEYLADTEMLNGYAFKFNSETYKEARKSILEKGVMLTKI